jgi:hypothetical protein
MTGATTTQGVVEFWAVVAVSGDGSNPASSSGESREVRNALRSTIRLRDRKFESIPLQR